MVVTARDRYECKVVFRDEDDDLPRLFAAGDLDAVCAALRSLIESRSLYGLESITVRQTGGLRV